MAKARAQVYKAVRAGVSEVACKVMRLDLLEGTEREQQLEAFMREAATLKACRDQHILMFLGACLKVRTMSFFKGSSPRVLQT